eukprot:jgi/Psemu1/287059/fgenesh1_pg.173_\
MSVTATATATATVIFEKSVELVQWIASVTAAYVYRFSRRMLAFLGAGEIDPNEPILGLLVGGSAVALVLVFSAIFVSGTAGRESGNGSGSGKNSNESKRGPAMSYDTPEKPVSVEVVELFSEAEDEADNEPQSNSHNNEEEDEDDWNEEEYRQRAAVSVPSPIPTKKETLAQMRLRVARELQEAEAQKMRIYRSSNINDTAATTGRARRKVHESRAEIKARVAREFAAARRK